MTLTLATLRERYVFESTPQRHNLAALHVPFDDLVGDDRTEARLDGAIHRNEPTAVIGASGSGKSSVIAHVLNALEEDIAPLVIPVAGCRQTPSTLRLTSWTISSTPSVGRRRPRSTSRRNSPLTPRP